MLGLHYLLDAIFHIYNMYSGYELKVLFSAAIFQPQMSWLFLGAGKKC